MRSFKLDGRGCVAALRRSREGGQWVYVCKKDKKRMTYIGSEGKNGTGR
jgi:hypothetical protein